MSASSRSDLSIDLVGRAAEVERLDAVLDRLHHGSEALVFRGEPGIGNSALLKHASWRAAESGLRTLATVGVESEAELAFAVRCCTTVHVYDAVVMGAGQASLSASYHLRLISGSTTYPRRGADGRSRPSPSLSQRRPAAAHRAAKSL